jgi:hypothetical protein
VLLAVVDVTLFMISGIKRYKDAHHGANYVISEIVWLGFLLGALTLIVIGIVQLVRSVRRRRAHA